MRFLFSFLTMLLAIAQPICMGGPASPKKATKTDVKHSKWDDMDIGPFQAYGLEVPMDEGVWRPALKGLNIRLDNNASICFDTERLRLAAAWTGGFLKLPADGGGLEGVPQPAGRVLFRTSMTPGWAGPQGEWTEPNPPTIDAVNVYSENPLPREWAKWRGHYTHGNRVVLSYTVGAAGVLESPAYTNGIFTRQFKIKRSPGKSPMSLFICEVNGAISAVEDDLVTLKKNGIVTATAVIGTGVKLRVDRGRVIADIKSLLPTSQFIIAQWSGPEKNLGSFNGFKKIKFSTQPLDALIKGGPTKWSKPIRNSGKLGDSSGAYVVDTITIPENNPWNSWIRCSGFDFFKNGKSAAICSLTGDVWIVSGIDETLKELTWRRYATGLFQPLGLKILDDQIYVLGRDQITRFHDLNMDGEADFYENFNNDVSISNHFNEYCLNLEVDSKGNFYFIKASNPGEGKTPHDGCLLKVTQDGKHLEVLATGHHARSGLCVGVNGEITSSDNKGPWVPTSRLNLIKPGRFYGHLPSAHREQSPSDYAKPLLWLPQQADNSSAAQVWVTSDKWGPFKGDLLHMSHGKCILFKIMHENVDAQCQGAASRFSLRFDSGILRARFNLSDGQLYLAGMRAWQTNGVRDGAFHRVRYTGKPVYMTKDLKVKSNGLAITFTIPVNPATAVDTQNWSIHQWNYQWAKDPGLKRFSVNDPTKIIGEKQQGDLVDIKAIKLSDDKKTVFLEIEDIKPVMQSLITFNMKFADGKELLKQQIFHTINRVPTQK
jgi:hypothetical protein